VITSDSSEAKAFAVHAGARRIVRRGYVEPVMPMVPPLRLSLQVHQYRRDLEPAGFLGITNDRDASTDVHRSANTSRSSVTDKGSVPVHGWRATGPSPCRHSAGTSVIADPTFREILAGPRMGCTKAPTADVTVQNQQRPAGGQSDLPGVRRDTQELCGTYGNGITGWFRADLSGGGAGVPSRRASTKLSEPFNGISEMDISCRIGRK